MLGLPLSNVFVLFVSITHNQGVFGHPFTGAIAPPETYLEGLLIIVKMRMHGTRCDKKHNQKVSVSCWESVKRTQ